MRGHRLINPDGSGLKKVPKVTCEPGEPVPVPFNTEEFVTDPESLKVWELGDGELPACEGFRLNFRANLMARPKAVCLSVTRACNLRCRYCYVQNRPDIEGGSMSVETAEKGIKLCHPKGTSISFFGGEPLLRFDMIREVVERAERMCEKPRFHVTTNGILLDDEKAQFLLAHTSV